MSNHSTPWSSRSFKISRGHSTPRSSKGHHHFTSPLDHEVECPHLHHQTITRSHHSTMRYTSAICELDQQAIRTSFSTTTSTAQLANSEKGEPQSTLYLSNHSKWLKNRINKMALPTLVLEMHHVITVRGRELHLLLSRTTTSRLRVKNGESFCEAWERFKGYTNQCPHHGFTKASLLSTLYRGVLPRIRMLLDTASNGNFQNKDVEEGWELVENLAQSDGNYNEDCDRTVRGTADSDDKHRKDIKALNDNLDKFFLASRSMCTSLLMTSSIKSKMGRVTSWKKSPTSTTTRVATKDTTTSKPTIPTSPTAAPTLLILRIRCILTHQQQGQNKPFGPYNQGFVPKQQFQGNYQHHRPHGFAPTAKPGVLHDL
ncbi:hypothetical protein ISN45_At05g028460 [Arabidopsis thaliana x Arabidopsis arenosa]|uniref:Retrotransposon gag domain-containing protein n=1 Tax=Arabidopsis thaliana x Arabidopsis arenosa TaxID=1240361 RepID=A0A8T2D460_9BRAS|nr:hypothetical protein ISN45_At05g028460 [Arabidopsis thaliana x Arabidopsis arenosa]